MNHRLKKLCNDDYHTRSPNLNGNSKDVLDFMTIYLCSLTYFLGFFEKILMRRSL